MTRAVPDLPVGLRWVRARQAQPHSHLVHVAHSQLELCLCGRVLPGQSVSAPERPERACLRCLSRARDLYAPV